MTKTIETAQGSVEVSLSHAFTIPATTTGLMDAYLYWVINGTLTLERYAEHYAMTYEMADATIDAGRAMWHLGLAWVRGRPGVSAASQDKADMKDVWLDLLDLADAYAEQEKHSADIEAFARVLGFDVITAVLARGIGTSAAAVYREWEALAKVAHHVIY